MKSPQNPARDGEQSAAASQARHDHDDEIADEWGEESFPASDPPATP